MAVIHLQWAYMWKYLLKGNESSECISFDTLYYNTCIESGNIMWKRTQSCKAYCDGSSICLTCVSTVWLEWERKKKAQFLTSNISGLFAKLLWQPMKNIVWVHFFSSDYTCLLPFFGPKYWYARGKGCY